MDLHFLLSFWVSGFIWISLLTVVMAGEGRVVTNTSEVLSSLESLILL